MKKLFLGLALTAGTLAFAQTKEAKTVNALPLKKVVQPVRYGIKAGGNSAYFSEQKFGTNTQRLGFHAGVFANIPLSEEFSLQPEVLYNQMGTKSLSSSAKTQNGETKIEKRVKMNYISVPLMLQIRPTGNFYIEAGPEFSYFIDGKQTTEKTVETKDKPTITTSLDKDQINRSNFGLGLGLGYDINSNIGISARYTNSLTKINKNKREETSDANNNRVFQLGLNYKF